MEPFVHDAVQDMQIARDVLEAAFDALSDDDWRRYVPYGVWTVRDLLAHVAAADHAWALAAQGLLRGEAELPPPPSREEARAARDRAIERGRTRTIDALREEMRSRRQLLVGLYGLLEKKHLVRKLPAFDEPHNSVRERIWLGYHDRWHLADLDRARRIHWYPQHLAFLPELQAAVDALSTDPVLYVAYSVDPTQWEQRAPDLEWTFRELLAHIATGDWVLQHHLRHIIETGRVADWPDVAAGNARLVAERRVSNDRALIEEYLSMRHETLRLIAALRPEHLRLEIAFWWQPPPNAHTVLDYLNAFHDHDGAHAAQLRPAMKHLTSPRA